MKPKHIDWLHFSSLVTQAIASGGELLPHKCSWDISKGCDKPFLLTLVSQPYDHVYTERQELRDGEVRYLDITTPCRKCPNCLKARQRLWISRMKHEIPQSNRTWLATFTINAHHRFMFSLRAKSRDYIDSYKEISKEFTKYNKRLRIKGHQFRYIMVAEAHKDGYPHLHALYHEVSTPIPKRVWQSEWPFGFTNFKLVKDGSRPEFYVAKYIAKDARTRIRASQKYGQSVRDIAEELKSHLNG